MQKLVAGIHHFQDEIFRGKQEMFAELVEGQSPLALFITCSDSRIDPSLLTQTQPGELFIMRNAGNIVPPYGAVQGGEAATIEYAVRALKVRDIVICGHSHCGAMSGLLHREKLDKLPAVRSWLNYAEATYQIVEDNYGHIHDADERLTVTVEENVLVQLENLRTHPAVAAGLATGNLKLHGWVYEFESGHVYGYTPDSDDFVSIDGRAGKALEGIDREFII